MVTQGPEQVNVTPQDLMLIIGDQTIQLNVLRSHLVQATQENAMLQAQIAEKNQRIAELTPASEDAKDAPTDA